MKPSELSISSVAELITQNKVDENIHFWIVYGALAIGIVAVIAIVKTYFSERGRLLAAAETLSERLEEIRSMTNVSERIKTQIAHNDWTLKEHKTLRRNKLENLMTASYKLQIAFKADADLPEQNSTLAVPSQSTLIELEQVAALYFPEFKKEMAVVVDVYGEFYKWLIEERSKFQRQYLIIDHSENTAQRALQAGAFDRSEYQRLADEHRANLSTLSTFRREYVTAYGPHYQSVQKSICDLQDGAVSLMASLIAPPPVD